MTDPLSDELTQQQPCKEGTLIDTSLPFDEFDGDRANDKSRLILWLTSHPKGVPVVRSVKALMPQGNEPKPIAERDYSNTDYQFARRFLERTKYATLNRDTDILRACPTPSAFHLTRRKQISNSGRGNFAKDRARGYIDNIRCLRDVKDAEFLVDNFRTYLGSIEDKRLMLEDEVLGDRITLPYATRFTSSHRKNEQWAKYHTAWEKATSRYERGILVTLTTDPKRYDSLLDMTDGLMDAWGNLLEALNNRVDGDGRLDYIRALEFSGSKKSNWPGLPHLHVVVFGTGYLEHSWLSNYWDKNAEHGEIVHVDPMTDRGSGDWTASMEDRAHDAKAYLGKYLSEALDAAEDLTSGDLANASEDWFSPADFADSPDWKLALYWATGRQMWDSSHSLKPQTKPDRLEDVDGLGETKLERLEDHGIRTLSDVRLTSEEDIADIDGISTDFASDLKDLVGQPSRFDIRNYEFVGASSPSDMPASWDTAHHMGIAPG